MISKGNHFCKRCGIDIKSSKDEFCEKCLKILKKRKALKKCGQNFAK